MPLHTIVSEFDVFGSPDDGYSAETRPLEGTVGFVEVLTVNGKAQVRRLISTDPRLYLDKRYQPGADYNTDPHFKN